MESKLTEYLHDFEKVPGVLKSSLYCIDAASEDYFWTIVWADKEAHDANARRVVLADAVIAGLFSTLFLRLLGGKRRFLAAGLSAACIVLYAILAGGTASVWRAAVMGSLGL